MFSLKCDKTLIKQIIKLQNQRPGFKGMNRESFPFETAVPVKSPISAGTILNPTNRKYQ